LKKTEAKVGFWTPFGLQIFYGAILIFPRISALGALLLPPHLP
jgi:hypothetical protein